MKRHFFLPLFILLLSGCMMPLQPEPTLPDLAVFEEGDIFVTTNGDVQSWFFALAVKADSTETQVPFSHAEMAFRDPEGTMMLGGVFGGAVDGENLQERLQKFYRVAVFRANGSKEKRKKAAQTMLAWLNDSRVSEAEFDYSMNYEPGRTDKLFCAGIINEACRVANLGYPFSPREWEPNALTTHIEEIVGNRLKGLLDLDSLYNSKDYQLVLEWQNDQIQDDTVRLSKNIILYLLSQYEQGWKLRAGDEFNLLLTLGNPSEVEKQFAQMKISLTGFQTDVFSTWSRLTRRGILDDLGDKKTTKVLAAIFDKYHEKYFYFADTAVVHNLQLQSTSLSR